MVSSKAAGVLAQEGVGVGSETDRDRLVRRTSTTDEVAAARRAVRPVAELGLGVLVLRVYRLLL